MRWRDLVPVPTFVENSLATLDRAADALFVDNGGNFNALVDVCILLW